MKKILAFSIFFQMALAASSAWGQTAAPKVRTAASLPPTCAPASADAAAVAVIVSGVNYICTAANTWTPAPGLVADNAGTGNNRLCGPNPWADISCFGARPLTGGAPTTTALCVKGNPQIVIAAPNTFQINDGVTIYGCGATNTMGTPAGLAVTPSEPWGLAETRSAVPGPAGDSLYEYTVVARDIHGALTAPATPVTLPTGQASLGLISANIRSMSRMNDRITVVTTEPNKLVAGALVDIVPKISKQFAGWYNVAKIDSATQFELWTTPTDTRAQGWMAGDTITDSGGGTAAYYQENFLKWTVLPGAWEYYVCAKRPGDKALKLIGVTKPTGLLNHYTDAMFEDYGSPYMDNQVFPSYVTDAICTGSATNDPLSTWVTAIAADGATLTLHDAPSQSGGKKTIVFDDAPGIMRALNTTAFFHTEHGESNSAIGGAIYIPPAQGRYIINSYLPIPRQVTIWQSGKLFLNETVSLAAGDNWFGDWSSQGIPQFGLFSGAAVYVNAASPGIYLMGTGNHLRNLEISDQNATGGTLLVADNSSPTNFDYINFLTGAGDAATDYTGMAVVIRDTTQTVANFYFDKVSISSGPDQVNDKSWTPSFWVTPGQDHGNSMAYVTMDKTYFNRRGIAWGGNHGGDAGVGGVSGFVSNWSYRQGGIIPYFTCIGCAEHSTLTFNDPSQDTEGQPLEAALYINPNSGYLGPRVIAHNPNGGSLTPLFSGLRASYADVEGVYNSASAFQNRDVLFKAGGAFSFVYAPYATSGNYGGVVGSIYTVGMPMHGIGGYSWWFDLSVPTNVAATAAEGGRVPAGTWIYSVTAVGADSGETILSSPSSPVTVSNGMQTVKVKWNAPLGAYSYNVWRCNTANPCVTKEGAITAGTGPWFRVALHTAGTTYTDTNADVTRYIPPTVTGTGATIVNGNGAYAPFFQAPPITVSQLPAAAGENAGQMRRVTDSTNITSEGQPCAGGGTGAALAFSNGTVWKCF